MSSDHSDTGLPAPTPQPVSTTDAARLLNSLRQAENDSAAARPAEAEAETASGAPAPATVPDSAPIAAAGSTPAEATVRTADSDAAAEPSGVVAAHGAGAAVPPGDALDDGAAASPAAEVRAAEPVSDDPAASYARGMSASGADPAADTSDSQEAVSETAASRPDVGVDLGAGTADDEIVIDTAEVNLPGEVASDIETIVHVLRHGEVHNPKGILYGRLSGFGLSVTGQAQAQAVARSLRDHDIALVVASPLQRAQETADPIATQHGLLIRTDDNLIEAGNTFEGLRVAARDGALRKPRHWLKLRDPFTPSWGEPYLQIAHRMLAAVNKARVEAAGREAVLVSHQLPVWTLRRFLQGQRLWHDPRRRQCSLASLTSLVYQGDTLIDIVYSEPAGATDPTVTGA